MFPAASPTIPQTPDCKTIHNRGMHPSEGKPSEKLAHERFSETLRASRERASNNNHLGRRDLLGGVSALQKTDLTGPILFLNFCQRCRMVRATYRPLLWDSGCAVAKSAEKFSKVTFTQKMSHCPTLDAQNSQKHVKDNSSCQVLAIYTSHRCFPRL